MSLALFPFSIVLILAAFATGVVVGCLAIGGSALVGWFRPRPKPSPAETIAAEKVVEALGGFRERLERLEKQMPEVERRPVRQAVPPSAAESGVARSGRRATFRLDVDSAYPDVERQMRDLVAEIRCDQGALQDVDSSGDAWESNDPASAAASRCDSATAERRTGASEHVAYIERRSRLRLSFFCKQWIAPYNGRSMPDLDEFQHVQCKDISSVGISFYVDSDPNCPLVVIRLGSSKGPRYLTARVRRVTPNDAEGCRDYTIGCQFLGTIHVQALPPWLDAGILRRENLVRLGDSLTRVADGGQLLAGQVSVPPA